MVRAPETLSVNLTLISFITDLSAYRKGRHHIREEQPKARSSRG